MIDVLDVEVLEWGHEALDVPRRVGNLYVRQTVRSERITHRLERATYISDVLEDVRQDNAVSAPRAIGKRENRSRGRMDARQRGRRLDARR